MTLKTQWHNADNEGKLALLKQYVGGNVTIDHVILGCAVEELDAVAATAGLSMIWVRGATNSMAGAAEDADGTWRRAACVSAQFAHLHPARTIHVARVDGWSDAPASS